jgi:predicted acyl esterase
MRDGVRIRGDEYRDAADPAPLPALLMWSPYGKHGPVTWNMFERSDVDVDQLSDMTLVECPDPQLWCRRGYVLAAVDPRGTWGSEGDASIQSHKNLRTWTTPSRPRKRARHGTSDDCRCRAHWPDAGMRAT